MKKYLSDIAKGKKRGLLTSCVKLVLWFLSGIYYVLVCFRLMLFKAGLLRSEKLPKPVISVGNMTVGGVGKTPLVALIAKFIKGLDKKPAILLRGYMQQDVESDEAQWYQQELNDVPVLVGADRVFEAKRFLSEDYCDVFILDDGFQHLALKRDLNILIIDALDPWGGSKLIPSGFMREPFSSLSRADMCIISKTDIGKENIDDIEAKIRLYKPDVDIFHGIHAPVNVVNIRDGSLSAVDDLKRVKVNAFCSIGSPESFQATLKSLKVDVVQLFEFMDHQMVSLEDASRIIQESLKKGVKIIITTEKDAVKFKSIISNITKEITILALRIEFKLVGDNKEKIYERITHLL